MSKTYSKEEILTRAEIACQEVCNTMAALAKGLGTEFPSESNAIGVAVTSIGSTLVTIGVLKDVELSTWCDAQKKLYRDTLGS